MTTFLREMKTDELVISKFINEKVPPLILIVVGGGGGGKRGNFSYPKISRIENSANLEWAYGQNLPRPYALAKNTGYRPIQLT